MTERNPLPECLSHLRQQAPEWQPIKNVPGMDSRNPFFRFGPQVLATCPPTYNLCRWSEMHHCMVDGNYQPLVRQPTHWLPIPEWPR
jgi:hypothetical protein